eukprot:CAMPEP_0201134878 /NCGR_PEP_ID=MMETSP0850-20130426/53007_1 /ASSEMBLY_ACC=CAM_ASM_000622 /TAXON_ID=183588 /ORGANISM="Pseudo-nitzschia fraudulenta, Strain WWA7" /LENGTH=104 /DNA_ID=CAMNT_0047405925 /DNA_START=734 /DNA_END=1048 /DNA_ORIENTATION=+
MFHMIEHVAEHDSRAAKGKDASRTRVYRDDSEHEDDPTSSAMVYDTVRGVRSIPLRKGIEKDPLQNEDTEEARVVWEHLLQPKTIRRGGGHTYFAIETTDNRDR